MNPIPTDDDKTFVFDLLYGFYRSQALQTFATLGVADELAARPRTAHDLAADLDCDGPTLYRFLRLCTALRLVDSIGDGTFALTGAGALLRSGTDPTMRTVVRFWAGDEQWRAWGALEDAIRSGEPTLEDALGAPIFPWLAEHPERGRVFSEAMAERARMDHPGIVEACDLSGMRTIVDLGGGNGTLLTAFLKANPGLSGELVDTPANVALAETVLSEAGLSDRARLIAGDFFDSVPRDRDAYVLKSVIHDWNDEQSERALKVCRDAMRADSVLYIVDPVIPDEPEGWIASPRAVLSDLNMLVVTGGTERTAGEFEALLRASGFTLDSIRECPRAPGFSVVTACPAG
ncbi:acetylserotonin O-methyltransferase [Amycolatopsis sp. EV170708-02-1]|uniref:acetylserotonin O-methyltransferase n=1 Tax=Amycolatopsis sp. EV170708-02-1 TaxID=2919322 RepID=UPI001F0C7B52|nr:acetylserotonin O-methyltransferase [Amycolatopsis sp. EV170708-02-1]UMP01311.1 acetylserotonin O-methyltransferase [Amycolatopsis sp. EV170708-02-1]